MASDRSIIIQCTLNAPLIHIYIDNSKPLLATKSGSITPNSDPFDHRTLISYTSYSKNLYESSFYWSNIKFKYTQSHSHPPLVLCKIFVQVKKLVQVLE